MFTASRVDILDSGSLKIQYKPNRYYDYSTGRWLTHDPLGITPNAMQPNGFDTIGQYSDTLNAYEYLSSNPGGMSDPYGLYEIDVHYFMTYWLASKIPCFSDSEAQQIGHADQGVDVNPSTAPEPGFTLKQQEKNARYHGLATSGPVRRIINNSELKHKKTLLGL